MKTIISKTVVCLSTSALMCHGQGFVNLGFESANVTPLPPGQSEVVFASNALPGWTVLRNSDLVIDGIHNSLSAGSAQFSILGPFYQPLFGGQGVLDGAFTAVLQPGASINGGASISLAQTAQVPLFANSIQFKLGSGNTNFTVSLGGQSLGTVLLQSTAAYHLYGADVSQFAGQLAELRFTGVYIAAPGFGPPVYLDAIQFSGTSVPEPGTWALLGLGSALFWCAARRRTK